ncbi:hypothetical protein Cgig2_019918 [Carnegiea gigantea]|uniref:Fe2OG dioxygenase domain-containing protein n=1 Tax=Carnegiea gigantea TaxID=171969 RepID=A0A9Q1QLF1_9CARY|nr:hypothetical protein Cgig2_019918 [Carnegiea gigantea]
MFDESKKFFSVPLEEKMKLSKKEHRGYTALYAEKLDPTSRAQGDLKESFYIGPLDDEACNLNQWPSKELLPNWRPTMEAYYRKVMSAGKVLLSLIALALNLDDKFFENMGALGKPLGFLRLLHYPGDITRYNEEILGASAHSDYGMITLLSTDGVPGLQAWPTLSENLSVCRDKDRQPRVWEDVPHIEGALIVNVGDITERWTNCLFRYRTFHAFLDLQRTCRNRLFPVSLHVITALHSQHDAAFFFDPPADLLVECIESCCSASNPPRFPPIRAGDYLQERFRLTYA